NFEVSAQTFENGKNPIELLGCRYFLRPGTRRFAADVDQIRAGKLHCHRMLGGARRVEKLAAVGKTVRRNVQHPHDERPFAEHQCARRESKPESFSAKHAASSLARAAKKKITRRRGVLRDSQGSTSNEINLALARISSEREPLGKYPTMIISMKRGGRDLHACCRGEAKPSANAYTAE